MFPWIELLERSRNVRRDSPLKFAGMVPVMEQELRSNTRKVNRLDPNKTGIGPGSENLEALKEAKRVRLTSESTEN